MTVRSDKFPATDNAGRLRRSADYRAMRGARRQHTASFTLQARPRTSGSRADASAGDAPRFGLTITKRIGNAVERNRIRRRLRAAVRACAGQHALPGHDYVLIAKRPALEQPFEAMVEQLADALDRISKPAAPKGRSAPTHESRAQKSDDRSTLLKEG